jgi:hypothetical protein
LQIATINEAELSNAAGGHHKNAPVKRPVEGDQYISIAQNTGYTYLDGKWVQSEG